MDNQQAEKPTDAAVLAAKDALVDLVAWARESSQFWPAESFVYEPSERFPRARDRDRILARLGDFGK